MARGPNAREDRDHRAGVAMFYIIAAASLLCEVAAVRLIRLLAVAGGAGSLAGWLAWGAFIIGGTLLGLLELRLVSAQTPMRNPILRACCWMHEHAGPVGFLINAAFLGGAPGTAVTLKRSGSAYPVSLTILAAAIFASVWVPIYVWLWR